MMMITVKGATRDAREVRKEEGGEGFLEGGLVELRCRLWDRPELSPMNSKTIKNRPPFDKRHFIIKNADESEALEAP